MNAKPVKWYAVSVSVPGSHLEAVESAFNGTDSLGTGIDLLTNKDSELHTVTAYFSSPPDDVLIRNEFLRAAEIYGVSISDDLELSYAIVESEDWLAEWKRHWRPVGIGSFLIAAPWHELERTEKTVVRIEPNMAFGTGTHETTRLCLDAISRYYRPDMSFLDVGTGTGILAIAAAKTANRGTKIVAIDIDPDAVDIAVSNAVKNDVGDMIEFRTGSIHDVEGNFDLVCANLTADVIIGQLRELLNATNNVLILSGVLAEQETSVTERLAAGTDQILFKDGEWIAVVIGRP